MPARLRRTRSSAFRANATFASPSKGSTARPHKKLKLDRGSRSVSLVEEEGDDEFQSEDEEGGTVCHDDLDDQGNLDPAPSVSATNRSHRVSRKGRGITRNQSRTARSIRQAKKGSLILASNSPRKRKRDDPEYSDDDEEMEEGTVDEADDYTDEDIDDADEVTGNKSVEYISGAPVEIEDDAVNETDNDSGEPEYIGENDHYLLREAPLRTLQRLKKAELKRLWSVAGLWPGGEDSDDAVDIEAEEGLTKDTLVEGIISARPPSSASTASSATRKIAKLPLARQSSITSHDSKSPATDSSFSDEDIVKFHPSHVPNKSRPAARKVAKPRDDKEMSLSQDKRAHFEGHLQSPVQKYRRRRGSHGSSVASSVSAGSPRKNPRASLRKGRKSGADPDGSELASDEHEDDSNERQKAIGRRHGNHRGSNSIILDGGLSASEIAIARQTPARRAARKATQAMHNQLDTDDEDQIDLTDADDDDDGDDPTPRPINGKIAARNRGAVAQSSDSSPTGRRMRRVSNATLLASPDTDSSNRSSIISIGSSDEEMTSSQQSVRRQSRGKKGPRRRDSGGYNLRRNDSSGFDLDARLEGIDLTDEDSGMHDGPAETPEEATDVEMTDQASEGSTSVPAEEEEDNSDDVSDEMLAHATQGTLRKLRKAVLVRMCEARELDTEGTKEQLSQWLIEWRDSKPESGSSVSTARPDSKSGPSNDEDEKVSKMEKKISVPKLLQNHSEVADPNTPAHSHGDTKDDLEADGALDLEELGLIDREIPVDQIQKGEKIGSGGFKDVYIGKLRGRVKVAVYEFRDELSEMDIRELKLLAEFSHPNIVRLLGIAIPERSLHVPCMVVTELCDKGDLFDYIRNVPMPTVNKVLKMMLDIAHGIRYLHDRQPRVIHRDCKSSNILINNRGVCKVGDFGLARVKNTTRSVIRSLVGTVNWQAPELWSPKPRYDYKVDVFSCAMVFWEMMAGWTSKKIEYPWEGQNEHWIYLNVGQHKVRPETKRLEDPWGTDLVSLIERMWHHDPVERPTMNDVVDDLVAIIEMKKKHR